jgi:hypothetical protein
LSHLCESAAGDARSPSSVSRLLGASV